jgi:hypothetical protein
MRENDLISAAGVIAQVAENILAACWMVLPRHLYSLFKSVREFPTTRNAP